VDYEKPIKKYAYGCEIKPKIIFQAKCISLRIYYLFIIIYVYACDIYTYTCYSYYNNYLWALTNTEIIYFLFISVTFYAIQY